MAKRKLDFEESIERLEKIVDILESGNEIGRASCRERV